MLRSVSGSGRLAQSRSNCSHRATPASKRWSPSPGRHHRRCEQVEPGRSAKTARNARGGDRRRRPPRTHRFSARARKPDRSLRGWRFEDAAHLVRPKRQPKLRHRVHRNQPVIAVLANEPRNLAKAGHPQVMQSDRCQHAAIDVEEVDQRRVEQVPTIDEGKVQLGLGLPPVWEGATPTTRRRCRPRCSARLARR